MEQYLKNFKNCLQKEIPFCAAECPFHIDIPEFIEKMKRGGFQAAFKTYRNAVGFPQIAAALCHEPCKEVCPGKGSDRAIELLKLEKACIAFTGDRSPTDYNLPQKKKRVAVVGAGLSGLACALRLCMKKYEVELFEKTDRIGGYLWELMPSEVFISDLEEQFKHEKYVLHLNTEIRSVEELAVRGFDAVYAAVGDGGEDFGLRIAPYCTTYGNTGWFAGGGLIGENPVYALANGLHMGTVIDNYLKTGNLHNPENVQRTAMCLEPEKVITEVPVIPAAGSAYGREEAKREASRCLECQCDFCRSYCDLTDYFKKWPLRIRDEIMATTLPGSADVKATPAKRLLSTCNQCGLCKETCPEDIDLGGLILEGRKSMHRQKKAPWVFHDFWLRDMDFANGEQASLSMVSPASPGAASGYAFFPGCQLGASDPGLVEKTYSYLVRKRPDTGLMLRCCGAPAEWSGDEEKFDQELKTIRALWNGLGRPELILACPTCQKKFKTYLPDIPVVSIYEIIAAWGMEETVKDTSCHRDTDKKTYSVFDACATRHEDGMKKSVRVLAKAAGCSLEPLARHDAFEQCCSFGGQPGVANPEYAKFVTDKRISESENPYLTYCINCRDVFTDAGKEAVHILDILFSEGKAPEKLPTASQRRENRIRLKRKLLKEFWDMDMEEEKKEIDREVHISLKLSEKLSGERILEEDVIQVLKFCERTGRRVYHPEKRTYSGYREIGYTTYWVEYRRLESETYELINAYAHRMKIELETVWNGRKTEPDL